MFIESETINLLLFQHLCHLDLSDNDFENMDELLETLPKLLKLQSLQLIGNPCSVRYITDILYLIWFIIIIFF